MSLPSAHLHVTDTYGLTLPVGARPQKASQTQSIELVEINSQGVIVKLLLKKALKSDVSIDYIGAWNPTGVTVTAGTGVDPSTIKVTKASSKEQQNGPVSMNVTASKESEFTDGDGSSVGAGAAEPDADTIVIKSVSLTLAESVDRSVEVKDINVRDKDGIPAWRATAYKKGTFGVRFKGDVPAGIALGTAGAGVYGFSGGVIAVQKLMDDQTEGEVNGGSFDGVHAPGAS